MSIYALLLESADAGRWYRIDLNKRNLWIGKKQYIKEGVVLVEGDVICNTDLLEMQCNHVDINNDCWNVIRELYKIFKHSVPHGRWRDKAYFKSLPLSELSDSELAYNIDRYLGQAMLEGYVLLGSLNGWIKWQDEDRWFWQDEDDKDLIVLRDWIEKKTK